MRLTELTRTDVIPDPEIRGITADSRAVMAGSLFAAMPGSRFDGRDFIEDALAKGAVAILAPRGTAMPVGAETALIEADDPRRRLAELAAAFYGRQPDTVVAVTGTNGKTSVADFARQLWQADGSKAASLGTLGVVAAGFDAGPGLTTPDPVHLHALLSELAESGIDHAALEASSHGLDQRRLDGVRVAAAVFTNLSRDHLDYHGSFEAYRDAKLGLFERVMQADGTAVINMHDPVAPAMASAAKARGIRVWHYGSGGEADIRLAERVVSPEGQHLNVAFDGGTYEIDLPLVGAFQAMNALAAFGLVVATGLAAGRAATLMSGLRGVHGRMEWVAKHPSGAPVFVDYAHTPDALETVLAALRPHVDGQLVVVFGCGGDRDRGKRPEMGRVAAHGADVVIVTDDNPRSEDPAEIRREALAGCRGTQALVREIGDRGAAIREAVRGLGARDALIIAGKGHETGQTVGGTVHPFDDSEVARAAVAALAEDAA